MQILDQVQVISYGATRVVSVNLTPQLTGVALSGTPVVTEVGNVAIEDDTDLGSIDEDDFATSSDLTITNESKNSIAITVLEKIVAVNNAVQFLVSGQEDNTLYLIKITCGTNGTPAETLVYGIRMAVQ